MPIIGKTFDLAVILVPLLALIADVISRRFYPLPAPRELTSALGELDTIELVLELIDACRSVSYG
jgi:hypothetical protein